MSESVEVDNVIISPYCQLVLKVMHNKNYRNVLRNETNSVKVKICTCLQKKLGKLAHMPLQEKSSEDNEQ